MNGRVSQEFPKSFQQVPDSDVVDQIREGVAFSNGN